MDSFSFTESQQEAIYRTLTAVGLEKADEWPKHFDAIESVVRRAVYKSNRSMERSPLYAGEAHKRLARLYEALNTAIQHYESLGVELQLNLDRFILLDPLLSASLPDSARSTAELVLSSGRLPHTLKSLAEATNQCAVSLNHQNDLFPKTGRTKKYAAFEEAVQGLMAIFEYATGRRPTVYSTEHKDGGYDGSFYPFAAAVLRPARLVPGKTKTFKSALLTAYTRVNDFLQRKKPRRKKEKK